MGWDKKMVEYENLSQEDKDMLIGAGSNFLESLTKSFGAEKAVQAWDQLADFVGKEYKHDIFYNLLVGKCNFGNVTITKIGSQTINVIKLIRTYTSMGLKEAKDITDAVRGSAYSYDSNGNYVNSNTIPRAAQIVLSASKNKRDFLKELRGLGGDGY